MIKEFVFKYLSYYYEMNLETYTKLKIHDKIDCKEMNPGAVKRDVGVIYGLSDEELNDYFGEWLDKVIIEFENKVADIQYEIYQKTGVELDLHESAWVGKLHKSNLPTVRDIRNESGANTNVGLLEYVRQNNTINYND